MKRDSGIPVVGNIPFGTHFCQFYHDKQDLLDTLVPYFRRGLEDNEYCVWIISDPLDRSETIRAMQDSCPDFGRYQAEEQIEFIPHSQWYLSDGTFDIQRVLDAWLDKLQFALSNGYDGLRVSGNTAWIGKNGWKEFSDYENEINNAIVKKNLLVLCTYSLEQCGATEILDVVNTHEFALIRRSGRWEIIESYNSTAASRALRESQERLLKAQRIARMGFLDWNLKTNDIYWSDQVYRLFGIDPERTRSNYDLTQHLVHPDDLELVNDHLDRAARGEAVYSIDHRILRPDGEVFWVHAQAELVRDARGEPARLLGTVADITERKAAEEKVIEHQQRLRSLASELSLAEERERRRIAAALHDHVGQNLAMAKIQLGVVSENESAADFKPQLDGLRGLLDQTIREIRTLTFQLSPPVLYELGFEPTVEWLLEQMKNQYEIDIELVDDGQDKPLTDDIRVLLFQAVRELLFNVVKHAQAGLLRVSIVREGSNIMIQMSDDGVGFEPASLELRPDKHCGFGLFSIRERLSNVGGSIEVHSGPGRGTKVLLSAPLASG